eukprot:m.92502 g.92502  ORF g.92502 m.92502 type:complete len:321 (+) comp14948_c0_seq1:2507-3469(+)
MLGCLLMLAICTVGEASEELTTRCTVVVSTARSGSTALSNAIMSIPNTFAMLEPYFSWSARPSKDDVPSIEEMASCQAWQMPQAQLMLSSYGCSRGHIFGCTVGTIRHPICWRCESGKLRPKELYDLNKSCKKSKHRLIKLIRTAYIRNWTTSAQSCTRTVYIHLIRDPWRVVKSIHEHGWVRLPTTKDLPLRDEVIRIAGPTCRQIAQASEVLARIRAKAEPHVRVLRLRHSTLLTHPSAVAKLVFEALGLSVSSATEHNFEQALHDQSIGNVGVVYYTNGTQGITDVQGRAWLETKFYCRGVYAMLEDDAMFDPLPEA